VRCDAAASGALVRVTFKGKVNINGGKTMNTFRGVVEGVILDLPRGHNGFGYDPLFYFPEAGKTLAELTAVEKSRYSHRGAAFRRFLEWLDAGNPQSS